MGCARSVLLILFLLAGSLSPPGLVGQESTVATQPAESSGGFALEQNYPNPVNPQTWIPFTLDESLFDDGEPVAVTIRIYNILNQVKAIPQAIDHPAGRGTQIINLVYREPGRKIAYWDGNDQSGRPVATGVYYLEMVVRGERPKTLKLTVLNPQRRRSIFPW